MPDCKACGKWFATMEQCELCPTCERALERLRNYAAPVVHGRWEQCFEDWRKQIEGDKCSMCGFGHYGASIAHYHFCPNCGAKMDGGMESG